MSKKLGFTSIVLLGINTIIGAGIFLFPHISMKMMGPASIIVVVFVGLLVLALSSCFAEAAALFTKNGGPYVYAKEAFGEFIGFEVGFIKWIIQIITWASTACALTIALGKVCPVVNEPLVRNSIIVILLISLGMVNIAGVNASKLLNNVITVSKLIPIVLFVAVGIFFVKPANFMPFFLDGQFELSSFGDSCLLWFYAFAGFESIAVASENMENPRKYLPRAILVVMGCVVLIYLLIHTLAIGILGPQLAVETTPIQTAMGQIIGPVGLSVVTAGTLVSIAGINIANAFITPRCAVALAQDGLLPSCFAKEGKQGTPVCSIVVSTALAIALALSGSYVTLVTVSVVAGFAQYIPTCFAILKFRKSKKDVERSYSVPFGPVIPILCIVVCIWLLTQASFFELSLGLVGLLIGIPFYYIMKKKRQKDGVEFNLESKNQKIKES